MSLASVVFAAVAVALAVALAVVVERERRSVAQRLDHMTRGLGGRLDRSSSSPSDAAQHLHDAIVARRETMVEAVSERRFLAALKSISLGVVVVDESGDPAFVNDVAAGFRLGRHGEAVVAQTIDELLARANTGVAAEERVQLYGPPRRRLHVTASPISFEGEHLGALCLIDDVTEEDRIDSIRRDFITNISHELRTPIGAVSLLAETLADERDPEIVEDLANRLCGEAHRLSSTVDDLLELSRIEHAGSLDFEPVELQGVVSGAHDRVRAAAQQREVTIGVNLPERDLVVLGDRRQLTSAIFNLLDNGIKYSGAGGGTLSVRARQIEDQIELTVQDSGIGIPRKDLNRIFERFYRVDSGRSRHSGGTGLGLSMVRHIVANHHGTLAVDSTEGEGSTFTILLPAYVPPGGDGSPDDHSDGDVDHEVRP